MTVRDLKEIVLRAWDVCPPKDFADLSDEHLAFWQKLNHLGARNMKTHPPEEYPDIDATVVLSDDEYQQLLKEARSL